MCDATFTFGQRGSHFFQCPSHQDYTRLPPKLTTLLTSTTLQKVHHLTLGHSDSFFLTYRDKSGHDHITSHALPTELSNFIYAQDTSQRLTRNIPKLRVTLGPYNTSFFAHDGSAYLWMNLPAHLLSALQSRINNGNWSDRPRIVALGADENFVLLTEKHAAVWDLPNYGTVSSMLDFSRTQDRGIQEVVDVVLHAYRYQCFVALSKNGTLLSANLPPHQVGRLEGMRALVMKDAQEAAKKAAAQKKSLREGKSVERRLTGRERAGGAPKAKTRRESSGFQWDGVDLDIGASSPKREAPVQRRPSNLQRQAELRRDWGEHRQEFKAQARGVKLSLSLSVSAGGLARIWGGRRS